MTAYNYDSKINRTIVDFTDSQTFTKSNNNGVTSGFSTSTEKIKTGNASGKFTARNTGRTDIKSAWVAAKTTFDPPLNLGSQKGLGVWIQGDGNGEIINFRFQSPVHISHAFADHYITIDFTGWRYFELIETESTRWSDYTWPDGWYYSLFREKVSFNKIETLSIWYNNLPLNRNIECYISPIKAIYLTTNIIENPSFTVGDKTIVFPVKMNSGDYLEFYSMTNCKLYNSAGFLLSGFFPTGELPLIVNGTNSIIFTCDKEKVYSTRANVTIITYGDILPVSVKSNELPLAYNLNKNYPNPFNPSTTIEFSLPKESYVTLKVYDIMERAVTTLLEKTLDTGTYSARFNASGLATGIYFYRLITPGFDKTQKMLLVK